MMEETMWRWLILLLAVGTGAFPGCSGRADTILADGAAMEVQDQRSPGDVADAVSNLDAVLPALDSQDAQDVANDVVDAANLDMADHVLPPDLDAAFDAEHAMDAFEIDICQPDCEGKTCGDDGCGGTCGECPEHHDCVAGACQFVPWCGDGQCHEGEDCSCPSDCPCSCGHDCDDGLCVWVACEGLECGYDGCGGECGPCPGGESCLQGLCLPVVGESFMTGSPTFCTVKDLAVANDGTLFLSALVPLGASCHYSEPTERVLMGMSPSGEVLWTRSAGHPFEPECSDCVPMELAAGADGDLLFGAVSWVKFPVVFDGEPVIGWEPPDMNYFDGVLLAYEKSTGNVAWLHLVGGHFGNDFIWAIDARGDLLVAGIESDSGLVHVAGEVFSMSPPANLQTDILIVGMNLAGEVQFGVEFLGSLPEYLGDTAILEDGSVLAVGSSQSPDFQVGDTPVLCQEPGGECAGRGFMARLSPEGEVISADWLPASSVFFRSIAPLAGGGFAVVGVAKSDMDESVNLGGSCMLTKQGDFDVDFIATYDAAGQCQWVVEGIGGENLEHKLEFTSGSSITVPLHEQLSASPDGGIYVMANYHGAPPLAGVPLPESMDGNRDAVVAHLGPDGGLLWYYSIQGEHNEVLFGVWSQPAGGTLVHGVTGSEEVVFGNTSSWLNPFAPCMEEDMSCPHAYFLSALPFE